MCEQMGLLDWLEGVELTDTAGLVDRTGLDAHLAALGVDDTRAVRANETRLGLALERVHDLSRVGVATRSQLHKRGEGTHLDLILLGDTLGDTDNETNLVLNRLDDSVGSGGGRNVENGRLGLDFPDRLTTPMSLSPHPPLHRRRRTSLTEQKMGSPR